MKLPLLTLASSAALLLASIAPAQQVFGGPGERGDSTVFVFTDAGPAAAASIVYGQPMWKDSYADFDAMVAQYKGTSQRLGKDWWTTFSTATAIEINGTMVPAGSYFLGIHIDKEANFHVLAFDASHAMQNKWMPWDKEKWTGGIKIPMTLEKDSLKSAPAQKMVMALSAQKDMTGGFAIHWGPHALTAKVNYSPKASMTEASADKMDHDKNKKGDHKGEHDSKRVRELKD